MAATEIDFSTLVKHARQGDARALAELARQYEPEVRIMARVLLGPTLRPYLDSVDLVQSIHRSLLIGLRDERFELSSPDHLLALALTMVRRKVARYWRRFRRQKRADPQSGDSRQLAHVLACLASRENDPARATAVRDLLESICRQLDPTDQRLLELRLLGHSTVEAARELNADPDALRVRLSRLRRRLQESGLTDNVQL